MNSSGPLTQLDVMLRVEYERGRADAMREMEEAGGPTGAAYEAGVQAERRRVLRATGDLHAAPLVRRSLLSREQQIAAAVSEMERTVRDHVPDQRCERGCALCVARIPVRQSAGWPAVTMPGTGGL